MFKASTNLYCDCCGDLIAQDVSSLEALEDKGFTKGYDYNVVEDKVLCATCDDSYTTACAICDNTFFTDNMVCIENVAQGDYICRDCLTDRIFPDVKEVFDRIHGYTN